MVSHGDSKSRIKVELRGEGHPLSTTVTSQHWTKYRGEKSLSHLLFFTQAHANCACLIWPDLWHTDAIHVLLGAKYRHKVLLVLELSGYKWDIFTRSREISGHREAGWQGSREEGSTGTSQGEKPPEQPLINTGSLSPRVLEVQDGSMCENKYLVHPLTRFHHLVISSQDPHCGLQEWNKNETGLKELGRGQGESCIYLII